jgi:hypothetical protein
VVALLVWFAAEEARQAALLDAREREAESRTMRAYHRTERLIQDEAPGEKINQAFQESSKASQEWASLRDEQERRKESWPARLRREVRSSTGW